MRLKQDLKYPDCQDIQFKVLNFSDPDLRFLRDELVEKLKQIKIDSDKKLVLLITGLEKSIGVIEEYPDVLVNLNFVRDDLRITVPHPLLLFLPDYALTRLAKYAPDFWAWGRKVFYFKTVYSTLDTIIDRTIFSNRSINSLESAEKQERIDLLLCLLSEYSSADQKENKQNLPTIFNIYNQLGVAYRTLGKYQKSINYLQCSLKIAQKIEDHYGEANSLGHLGNAYDSLGKYQKAIDFFQQSLEIAHLIGHRRGEANSWFNLGSSLKQLKQQPEAHTAYKNAEKLYQSMKLDRDIEKCDRAIQDLENQ